MEFIDLKSQYKMLQSSIDERVLKVLRHGQFIMGPEVHELEERLAEYCGAKHCIACASGTDALLIALMALGIGPGDEVITTPFTFIATAEAIALVGAKPVFVDIDPITYNLDPKRIRSAISPKTKAIIPVSLYGQCADMDAIKEIAGDIPVIEDAAQSFGATYRGQRSCNLSTIGCTSFYPAKPLGCYGDGGACFTSDDQLAARMKQIRVHGEDRRYHHTMIGINGRLDTVQAAVLLAKLERFDEEVSKRAQIGARYSAMFGRAVITPRVEPHNTSVFAQYTIQVERRAVVQDVLKGKGIPTAIHYPIPIHLQPAFSPLKLGKGSYPAAEHAAERVLSLPMHPYLKEQDQQDIVTAVSEAMRAAL